MNNNWEKIQLRKLGYSYGGLTNKTKDDFGEGKPYIPYLNIFENSKIECSVSKISSIYMIKFSICIPAVPEIYRIFIESVIFDRSCITNF